MPPIEAATGSRSLMLALLGILAVFGSIFPPFGLTLAGLAALMTLATPIIKQQGVRKLTALAHDREGESICTFARAFDCRATDTWIIRAVYEQLQGYLHDWHQGFPIRPEDHWKEDLGIDPEDMTGILMEIETRTGRTLTDDGNSVELTVETVRDLVNFFDTHSQRVHGSAVSSFIIHNS